MYYYFKDNEAIIQSSSLRFRKINTPQKEFAGEILSELIYFDYEKLYEECRKNENESKPLFYIQVPMENVCEETKNIINQLLLTNSGFRRRDKSYVVDRIKEVTKHIEKIICSDDFENITSNFVEFYFNKVFSIKLTRQEMFFDNYAKSAIAPVLYKYNNDYEQFSKLAYYRIRHRTTDDDGTSCINKYLERLDMTKLHRQIAKKVFAHNSFSISPDIIINKSSDFNLTENELFEYIKLTYEYENANIYVVNNLPEFLVALFVDCIDNKIELKQCEHCGKIYHKTGRRKYCSKKCKNEVKKEYENERICIYKTESGEEIKLNYNTILKNFENKVGRVIDHTENEDLKKALKDFQRNFRCEIGTLKDLLKASQENKDIIQNGLSELVYRISKLYNKRNSLLNECEKAIEDGNPICIKKPVLTEDYKVIIEEFIISIS